MKRFLTLVLMLCLCVGLCAGCAQNQQSDPQKPENGTLTAEELEEFQAMFTAGSWYSQATTRSYTSPKDIDLHHLFYDGIGFYGLVRNVRDAALASIDAGGDFVAVGKDVSRAILGASMPSARAAWSIASDIATRTAASAAEKGLRCPARHMLASGAEGAARAAAPSRGAGR